MKSFGYLGLMLLCTNFVFAQTNTGIGTITPTERLDVGTGNVRVRNINTVSGNVITDNIVVADANGVLKTIPNNFPVLAAIALKTTNMATSIPANTYTTIIFDSAPKTQTAFVTYNVASGIYTVARAGFYNISTFVNYNIPTGLTAGTAISQIIKNGSTAIAYQTSNHTEITRNIGHSVTTVAFFAIGDTISARGVHTRDFRIEANSSISLTYLSN